MSEEIKKVEEAVEAVEVDGIFTKEFWRSRIGKVSFWAAIIVAIFTPILAAAGMDYTGLSSWPQLWNLICSALSSPATSIAIAMSLWTAINNPTSSGLGDVK